MSVCVTMEAVNNVFGSAYKMDPTCSTSVQAEGQLQRPLGTAFRCRASPGTAKTGGHNKTSKNLHQISYDDIINTLSLKNEILSFTNY